MRERFRELEKKLKVRFRDPTILSLALTHRSALETKKVRQSNERLEFLGDTVLELIVSRYLYEKFPSYSEGRLTKLRSALVCQETLNEVARELNLGSYLILGKGEDLAGGREKPHILANAVEALIGAIYLDKGLTAARRIIHKKIISKLPSIIKQKREVDPKTMLQEYVQSIKKVTPKYKTILTKGPEHKKKFVVVATIDNIKYMVGEGKTKQEAEQNAAKKTLKFLKKFGFAI